MKQAQQIRRLYQEACDYVSESDDITDPKAELAYDRFRELDALLPPQSWRRYALDSHIGLYLAYRYLTDGSAVDRDEAIERLLRAIARPDPDGNLDGCRLMAGQMLADRGLTRKVSERDDLTMATVLLGQAAASPVLEPRLRAEAQEQLARLQAILTMLESWDVLAARQAPDVEKLLEARRTLPASDPHSPALSLALGLALGIRGRARDRPDERDQAIGHLLTGLEAIDKDNPWRDYALTFLAALLAYGSFGRPQAMPADRVVEFASRRLAAKDTAIREAGVYHAMIFFAGIRLDQQQADDSELTFHFDQARTLLPADHELRSVLLPAASNYLIDRQARSGSREDGDAATVAMKATLISMREMIAKSDQPVLCLRSNLDDPGIRTAATALFRAIAAREDGDADAARQATREAEEAAAVFPAGNPWSGFLTLALAVIQQVNSGASGELTAESTARVHEIIRAAETLSPGVPWHSVMEDMAGLLRGALGVAAKDLNALDAGINQIREAQGYPQSMPGERTRMTMWLGRMLCERFLLSGDRRDLNNGVSVLERARHGSDDTSIRLGAEVLWTLAESYRLRGDPQRQDQQRAIRAGLLALTERASDVLLQGDAKRGLAAAEDVGRNSSRLVSWCLQDRRLDQAVQAVELGRALVLHITTLAPDIPSILESAGLRDLATSWRHDIATRGSNPWDVAAAASPELLAGIAENGPAIPAAIGSRVLAALRDIWPESEWLAPPVTNDLAKALRDTDNDAFVYLLPPDQGRNDQAGTRGGWAVLLRSDGELRDLALPDLAEDAVARYDEAHLAYNDSSDDLSRQRWLRALDDLCEWAWTAVMERLLHLVSAWVPDRTPRLVLIPAGRFGAVPWHAARAKDSDGGWHYALVDAVFSYAASARQLLSASRRRRPAWEHLPVLVANPSGDLPIAGAEAREIQRRYYPGAVLLGRPKSIAAGPGTAQDVLARLPGGLATCATLLHLGCHAQVAGSLAESYLLLAGDERLTIARIVAQAQGRDKRAPGFLAVLGACMSDLADVEHDEALTLASGLLAAGASGVIGARWRTRDLETATLMIMFHHFINQTEEASARKPADALRLAQLWMLDQNRAALSGLPVLLADGSALPELADPHSWAAFTYQGS